MTDTIPETSKKITVTLTTDMSARLYQAAGRNQVGRAKFAQRCVEAGILADEMRAAKELNDGDGK